LYMQNKYIATDNWADKWTNGKIYAGWEKKETQLTKKVSERRHSDR
jgi:hypothetical protein